MLLLTWEIYYILWLGSRLWFNQHYTTKNRHVCSFVLKALNIKMKALEFIRTYCVQNVQIKRKLNNNSFKIYIKSEKKNWWRSFRKNTFNDWLRNTCIQYQRNFRITWIDGVVILLSGYTIMVLFVLYILINYI